MKRTVFKSALVVALMGPAMFAHAAQEYTLTIKDHKFSPETIEVPAGIKVKLIVKNQDATPEEFESHKLHREKIIQGNSQAIIHIGPLKPGSYPFVGEFHEDSAKGVIVVK